MAFDLDDTEDEEKGNITSIPINKIKQKMFEYKKIAEELYKEFLRTGKTNIRDLGMSYDNRAIALEELLKEE